MTREEIIEKVNSLLAEEFEDLIALVQFNYKITIPVEDLKKIQTFDNLYDYILEHQPA